VGVCCQIVLGKMSVHEWSHIEPVGLRQPVEDRTAARLGTAVPKRHPPPSPDQQTPREQKLAFITPGYPSPSCGELLYFPLRARAESLKLILHYSGLAYHLRTIALDEWPEWKATMPNGHLPCFRPTIDGAFPDSGELMPETLDIAIRLAGMAESKPWLLPSDAAGLQRAAKIFAQCVSEDAAVNLSAALNWHPKDEALASKAAVVKECVAVLKSLEPELKKAPFFGGDKPCYADFGVFSGCDNLKTFDADAFKKLGAPWVEFYQRVAELRGVKEFLKYRPKAGTGKIGRPGSLMSTTALDD